MKKLSNTQMQTIVGGAGTSGAFLSGLASIIGNIADFILDVATIPLVYLEASKNHDQAKFKLGSSSVEFDDSITAKKDPLVTTELVRSEVVDIVDLTPILSSQAIVSPELEHSAALELSTFDDVITYFG